MFGFLVQFYELWIGLVPCCFPFTTVSDRPENFIVGRLTTCINIFCYLYCEKFLRRPFLRALYSFSGHEFVHNW